jgi:hypothetical protein
VTVAGNRKLVIEILGNAKDASKAFGDVRKQSEITKERLDNFGTAALGAGVAIAGGLAFAVKEFVAADEQSRKLDNSIKNSTQSFTRGGDAIRELTTELQNLSGADGDALVGASSLAVQWGLSESQITKLLPLVNDLSMKMGIDVDSAMKAVLKSTDGSSTALRKMGIQVDQTKIDSLGPFGATIDALKGSVEGFGAEVGNTSAGKLAILKQQLGDLVEAVGGGTMDVFGPIVSGLTNFINGAGPAGQAAGDIAGKVLAISTAGLLAVGGIVKIKGAVDTAKTALTTATGELNNFGRAAQIAGAIAGGIAIFGLLDQLNQATVDSVGLKAAIDNLATAKGPGQLASAFNDAYNKSQNLAAQILSITGMDTRFDPFAGMTVTIDGVDWKLNNVATTLKSLSNAGDTEALNNGLLLLSKYADGDAASMKALAGVLKPYQDAAKASTQRTKEQAGAHQEAANAADEQNAALKALTDPVFGAMRAQQQNTQAQEKYAEAQNKVTFLMAAGKAGAGQLGQAQRELQAASIDAGASAVNQQTALASLGGAMQNGTVTASGLNTTLSGLVASGQLSAGAALTLAASFNNGTAPAAQNAASKALGVTAAVGTIPNSKTTTIKADTGPFEASLSSLMRSYGPIIGVWKALGGGLDGNPATPLATGGTTQSGKPYLVGERGPEVIVPGSGYVIPTRRLIDQQPAMAGAGGGAVTINVTTGVGDPVAIGRSVVESLRAYERTNGTAWRN